MKNFLLFILFMVFQIGAFAQVLNEQELQQKIKQQATAMGEAFLHADYKSFSLFTNPRIVEMMGGSENMIKVLLKTMRDMKSQGMIFSKISFDEPTKIIKAAAELQSTILQHTEIRLNKGRVIATSALIAVSSDKGLHWTFIDTSNKDLATIKKLLPELSYEIVLPEQKPPVKYDE
jgi:hypothetical protein